MNELKAAFSPPKFIGSFNVLPSSANIGDMCIVDNKVYIYGFNWCEVASLALNPFFDCVKIKDETLYLT